MPVLWITPFDNKKSEKSHTRTSGRSNEVENVSKCIQRYAEETEDPPAADGRDNRQLLLLITYLSYINIYSERYVLRLDLHD